MYLCYVGSLFRIWNWVHKNINFFSIFLQRNLLSVGGYWGWSSAISERYQIPPDLMPELSTKISLSIWDLKVSDSVRFWHLSDTAEDQPHYFHSVYYDMNPGGPLFNQIHIRSGLELHIFLVEKKISCTMGLNNLLIPILQKKIFRGLSTMGSWLWVPLFLTKK